MLLPLGAEVVRQIEGYVLDGMDLDSVSVLSEAGRELVAVATLLAGEVQSYRHLLLRIATSWAGWVVGAGGGVRVVGAGVAVAGLFAESAGADAFVTQVAERMTRLAQHRGLTLVCSGDPQGPADLLVFGSDDGQAYRACKRCTTRQRLERTRFRRSPIDGASEELRLVHTPGATPKALFLATSKEELVFAVVRGGLDVNLVKLRQLVGRDELRPADESEIIAAGAVPGFGSPIGLHVRR